MKGVDLNQYRNLPDYGQLRRDGCEFAIIKLATGLTFRNPLFEKQYDGCKAAGLHLGEGTGAVLMFSLLDTVGALYENKTTFSDIKVEQYTRF